MAREYSGSPKNHQLESKRRCLTWIIGVSGLCILFYILGAWQNTNSAPTNQSEVYTRKVCDVGSPATSDSHSSSSSVSLDFDIHHQVEIKSSVGSQKIPPCDMSYSEYTPCQDPVRARKFDRNMLKYREWHCPTKEELLLCLIPAPPKYKNPFKCPQSRDYAWYDNIPHKELSIEVKVKGT